MTRLRLPVLILAGLAWAAPARAGETFITPFGGIVFGGDLAGGDADDFDTDNAHGVYGLALSHHGDGPLGIELEFDYSPNFFGSNNLVPDNNLSTLMLNLLLSGGDRTKFYLAAGGGLMRTNIGDAGDFFDVSRNDFAIDAGAGLLLPLSDSIRLRADMRYFRNFGDSDAGGGVDLDFSDFDYWRATGGLAIRF